ncbi:MAG: 2,3-bisphosphoglycerate-dependent phosphoglycerate mutase [Thermoleophilaceae bacterium]|nr:2,3-bisphosphoglycerate-dependent phosphoglycerate mutase [Thermoleophilaceae bacterium]MEA2469466.1 2,3-bisphosphoglycerate-dependent phosphoglycerate mutase [Thermoleophilaceae bacterium]
MSDGIWLARHGETDANAEGRVQGSIDEPLNERGREQARALAGEAVRFGLGALYTSQLSRARETAEIVGAEIGLEPVVDARFAESWRGEWEGRLIADIRREDPDAWERSLAIDPAGFRFPGGESLEEHAARVEAALADVARGPLPALVVCHGGTIRRALARRRPHELTERPLANGVLVQVGDDG